MMYNEYDEDYIDESELSLNNEITPITKVYNLRKRPYREISKSYDVELSDESNYDESSLDESKEMSYDSEEDYVNVSQNSRVATITKDYDLHKRPEILENGSNYDSSEDNSNEDEDIMNEHVHTIINYLMHAGNKYAIELDSAWKQGLSLEEIEELEPMYERIANEMRNREITEVDIMKSKMTLEEKTEVMELLRVKQREMIDTASWLHLKRRLYNRVIKRPSMTDNDKLIADSLAKYNNDEMPIELRILRSKLDEKIKAKLYREYCNVRHLGENEDMYCKMIKWIKSALMLPTETINIKEKYESSDELLVNVNTKLSEIIFGQIKAKERILEILSAMWANPNKKQKCITFIGAPGTGKTAFARGLADGMGLPFYQISLGGAKDSSFLKGHGFTYIGSMYGKIVEALLALKYKNGILYLDELDKLQNTAHGQEVASTLLHILDPAQNSEFEDEYLAGIPIDLSNLIIVISINNTDTINPILKDRLELIEFIEYSDKDKIDIGHNYILPKVMKSVNMTEDDIIITREAIEYIIKKSRIVEKGVRQMERNITSVIERLNTLKQIYTNRTNRKKLKLSYDMADFKLPFFLTIESIDKLFREYELDRVSNSARMMYI